MRAVEGLFESNSLLPLQPLPKKDFNALFCLLTDG